MKATANILGFMQQFNNEEACKGHLYHLKWGNGYTCRKCGHDVSGKGRTKFHRRCRKCKYDESCTAHTLFHKIKFALPKAFLMVYQLSTMKKGMSSCELSRQFGIHQETAWYFRQKVMLAMSNQKHRLLNSSVEVDETVIGGRETGKPGRSHGLKKKVAIAIEVDYPTDEGKPRIRAADARIIDNYSSQELGRIVDEMIEPDALVTTDGLPAYQAAVQPRMHDVWLSDKGENFQSLHWHIFNLKSWIRGIHHHISAKHAQKYLNEFHFRFKNRNWIQSCPNKVLRLMTKTPKTSYSQVIAN